MTLEFSIAYVFLFILTPGLGFTLRGIWGHQTGGAIMGTLFGLMVSYLLSLPLVLGLSLTFWLAIAWAIASFVGWAKHKGITLFFRGYLFYGVLPSFVFSYFLFYGQWLNQILISFVGGLGMGIGYLLSYSLRRVLRKKIEKKFRVKYPQYAHKELRWGGLEKGKESNQVSFIYVTKFDTWKFTVEIASGIWYGITLYFSLMILSDYNVSFSYPTLSLAFAFYFYIFMLLFVVPLAALFIGFAIRSRLHDFLPQEEQKKRWSKPKRLAFSLFSFLFILVVNTLVFISLKTEDPTILLTSPFSGWKTLFLIALWFYIFIGRLCHELDALIFKMDFIVDVVYGSLLTIILLIVN